MNRIFEQCVKYTPTSMKLRDNDTKRTFPSLLIVSYTRMLKVI